MLEELSFSSYKRFRDENIVEIRPVTVLVGKNSSGKSSICKLLPVLAKSLTPYCIISPLLFESDGVCIGTSFGDVSHNGNSVGLSFGLSFSGGVKIKVNLISEDLDQSVEIEKYSLTKDKREYILTYDNKNSQYETNFQKNPYPSDAILGFYCEELFEKVGVGANEVSMNVEYIGPFRVIPQRTYYSKGLDITEKLGTMGENSYNELYNNPMLEEDVSSWYSENFGVQLTVDSLEGEKGLYHVNMRNPISDTITNIVDEGQGMSQVLPIVVRCNMPIEDSIVVMEQPELHLHPKAHASLGKLFATTSKANKQSYLVETHSENLLLGLRDAVVDENVDFSPEDVIIYFVDEDEEDGSAYLRKIEIDADGMLSDWPTGVFNESYELLSAIKRKSYEKRNREGR